MTNIVSKQTIRDARLDHEDQPALSGIDEIIEDMRNGKPVILVDDEDRENEGDLVIAAQMATPENINFMARDGRGLICLPMESEMVERLNLPLMGRGNNSQHRTAFTVSIEAQEGVTTGISAADRARTIQVAINANSTPVDIATPGHVFPLMARDGGVLVRAGHTEAAVDLAKMAGFSGAGVICEIMNDDGTMARLDDLIVFSQKHGLKVGTIADLIAYRRQNECLIEKIHSDEFVSAFGGSFTRHIYANMIEYAEHIVLVKGNISAQDSVLVRMHSVDMFQDVLGGSDEQALRKAMEAIDAAGAGIVVILREPDMKSLSQRLQPKPDMDAARGTSKGQGADLRNYGIGAQILRDLGVSHMTLLSNSARNIVGLDGYGLYVDGTKSI